MPAFCFGILACNGSNRRKRSVMVNPLYLISAKGVIASVCSICDSADKIGAPKEVGYDYKDTELSTKTLFRYALTAFCLHLTASDGKIHDSEVELVNQLLDWNFSRPDIKQIIDNENIYSPEFSQRVPAFLPVMARVDKMAAEVNMKPHAVALAIEAFEVCGETLVKVDGREVKQESADLKKYLMTLKLYEIECSKK